MCLKNILFLLVFTLSVLETFAQELHLRLLLEGPATKALDNGFVMRAPPAKQLLSYGLPVPENAIDQITLLLLDPLTGAVQHSLLGWLRKDGQVMNLAGSQVYLSVPTGTFQVMLKHRNHLPIITQKPVSIHGQTVVDFTQPDVAKQGSFVLHPNGRAMMIAGNIYDEATVRFSEINATDAFLVSAAVSDKVPDTLIAEDLNLDGKVDEFDYRIVEKHSLSLSYTTTENK